MVARSLANWLAWTVCAVALVAGQVRAHPAPNSAVYIDVGQASVGVELVIPLGELESALRPRFGGRAKGIATRESAAVASYLLEHVGARTLTGQAWPTQLRSLSIGELGEHQALVANMLMTPPPGASARSFDLHLDTVTHEVRSHVAVVLLRSDFYAGKLSAAPEFIAGLQHPVQSLRIDQGNAQSWLAGLGASFILGLRHIAEGTDHLLFVLTLVLAAPVVASGKRWVVNPGWRGPAMSLMWATMAFSLGHAVSLVLGVASAWHFASGPVDLLVAVSILVSAVHAWRPVFPGREAWVAGFFGLVHGAAFSTALGGFALEPFARTVALLGFTAGIEALQLLLVSLALPLLLALRATAAFNGIRLALGALSGAAAIAWIVERAQAGVGPALIALADPASRGPVLATAAAAVAAVGLAFASRALGRNRRG